MDHYRYLARAVINAAVINTDESFANLLFPNKFVKKKRNKKNKKKRSKRTIFGIFNHDYDKRTL